MGKISLRVQECRHELIGMAGMGPEYRLQNESDRSQRFETYKPPSAYLLLRH